MSLAKFNGVLLIDKQAGITSHDVVDILRKKLGIREIGHGGTLDPLATGLLICLLGEATKLSQFVMSEEKSYHVGVKLGLRTDSGDITGKPLEKAEGESNGESVTEAQVRALLPSLVGALELEVPKYSAIKVAGRKLYEYARKNEDVAIPVKTMTIHSIKLVGFKTGHLTIDMECEKGTYVRSWTERLGRDLGCGATVETLKRTRSGSFIVDQAHLISDFDQDPIATVQKVLIPLVDVLHAWPALKMMGRDRALVANGQLPKGVFSQLEAFEMTHGIRLLDEDGSLLALAVKDAEKGVKLARVFNTKS